MIHQVVKGIVPQTSLFNTFFAKMGDTFGYGPSNQKAEEWWEGNFPVLGVDTVRVAFDGGYKKQI